MHAEGLAGETPFAFGTVPLRFHWAVSDPAVLVARSLFHAAQVALAAEQDFAAQIEARHAGTAALHVRVEAPAAGGGPRLLADGAVTAATQAFEVVEALAVRTGSQLLVREEFGGFFCFCFFFSLTVVWALPAGVGLGAQKKSSRRKPRSHWQPTATAAPVSLSPYSRVPRRRRRPSSWPSRRWAW